MKLKKLLKHMTDDDIIRVVADYDGKKLFSGWTYECGQHRKLLKRKITFLLPADYELVVFVK